jgi:hypothetical protein
VNSPPPKPEVILTNFFAVPTVLLVPITSRVIRISNYYGYRHNKRSNEVKNSALYNAEGQILLFSSDMEIDISNRCF